MRQVACTVGDHTPVSLTDMLQELRILQLGVQVLTAFLIILPFSQGFQQIEQSQKLVYLATFICALSSLVLFSAPAAQHTLERPLMDKARFKEISTRMIILGLVPCSLALILSPELVVSVVAWQLAALVIAGLVTILILALWWVIPLTYKHKVEEADEASLDADEYKQ
jgi:hypothetical protein